MDQFTFTTESERLFAEYLDTHGYKWSFEPTITGRRRHPDFRVPWDGDDTLFDVKECQSHGAASENGHFNPLRGIREEIEEARRKFKEFKDYCCALVIYDAGDAETPLDPIFVFGAMLGNPGVTMQPKNGVGQLDTIRSVFLKRGGKMVRYKTGEYQNKTISAVIVLERRRIKNREFDRAVDAAIMAKERERACTLEVREQAIIVAELIQSLRPTFVRVPRVIVCEHPSPRIPLPQDMFTGPYDERYAIVNDSLTRVFAGADVTELEGMDNGEFSPEVRSDDNEYF